MIGNKTRKQRSYGGDSELAMREYASLLQTKSPINTSKFKDFLNSIKNPLKLQIAFDNDAKKYTINEYALIHNAGIEIHSLFRHYSVDLVHKVKYNFDLIPNEEYTILEAYILHGFHLENIRCILEQIIALGKYDILFNYPQPSMRVPTVLRFAIESSDNKKSTICTMIYQTIVATYMNSSIYKKLSNDNSPSTLIILFQIATMYKKIDLMVYIYTKITEPHEGFNLIFDPEVVSRILLHDDPELYIAIIELLNYSDENVVKSILHDYANDKYNDVHKEKYKLKVMKYLQVYKNSKNNDNAKKFFEKLGKYTIDNVIFPYTDTTTRIIMVCHGISRGESESQVAFPFNKLCYFTDKGKSLTNHCLVFRSIEELVCAGNYDNNLQCIEASNNMIMTEDMVFSFAPKTRNEPTGIYICENRQINRAMGVNLLKTKYYTMQEIIGLCSNICEENEKNTKNVNLLVFACRGYSTVNNTKVSIEPCAIVDKSSSE